MEKTEYSLKVRNNTTVEPPLTATSLRRPFFGGEGGGQSMYSLFFQPLYNGHLSTTAIFWGGGGGGSPCIRSSFNLSTTATSLRRPFFWGGGGGAVHLSTLLSTSLRRPFFGVGRRGPDSPCIHSSFNLFATATFFCPQGGRCGEVQLYISADLSS